MGIEHPDPVPRGRLGDDFTVAFDGTIVEALDRNLHVGLAGSQPDLAHKDVRDHDLVPISFHGDAIDVITGLRSLQVSGPMSAGIGLRKISLSVPRGGDRDGRAGRSIAPDRSFCILLKDHMVSSRMPEGEFGVQDRGGQQQGGKQDCLFHKGLHRIEVYFDMKLNISVFNDPEGRSFRVPAVGADHDLEVAGLADPLEIVVVVG